MSDTAGITVPVTAITGGLAGDLDRAKSIVAQKTSEMAAIVEHNDPMKKFFRREQVSFVLNAIGQMAKLTASLMRAAKGDTQALIDTIEQLPFGIGQVGQGIHALYDEITGFQTAMERLDKSLSASEKLRAVKEGEFERIAKAKQATQDATEQRKIVETNDPAQKIRMRGKFDVDAVIAEMNRRQSRNTSLDDSNAIGEEAQARIRLINAQVAAQLKEPQQKAISPSLGPMIETGSTGFGAYRFAGNGNQFKPGSEMNPVVKEAKKANELHKTMIGIGKETRDTIKKIYDSQIVPPQ